MGRTTRYDVRSAASASSSTGIEQREVLEGPDGTGQRRRQHGHWGGRRSEVGQVVTRWEPGRALAWRHEAERLDGKPAPRFAASTDFTIELVPEGGGRSVRLQSAQQPAGPVRGLVIRAFGRREVAQSLRDSLERLSAARR
jgi:Polyketide cyclase / dehydrase and lipid transport